MKTGTQMRAALVAVMAVALAAGGCGNTSIGAARLQLCETGEGPRDAYCGKLTVFEDRARQTGRTIDLKIVVAKALRRDPKSDPLFVLVGGPTGGAATMAERLEPMFRPYQTDRDIVFVDQRGTGASNPLDCEPPERTLAALVENPVERLQKCLEDLDADPRFYTTAPAMDDIDEVRRYLGYDLINFWGSSYGTRAALVYLARHEAAVRSLVLDSAAPIDTPFLLHTPRDGQRALDRLIADCASQAACARRFPHLAATVKAVLDQAAKRPTIHMIHPRTGVPIEGVISRELIASTIFYSLYTPATASLLPQWLSDAERGDFQGLLSLRLLDGPSLPGTGEGAFLSVHCSEDASRFTRENAVREASGTFLGTAALDTLFKPCAFWPKGTIETDFYNAPVSQKPVLVLSGDLDPVLPPALGEQAAKSLPHARHLVVPGAGHMTSLTGCVPRLIEKFLETADAGALDSSCLERLHRPPFVTSRTVGLNP
ncbi:MAG TPA: alpha/beta hydrolase [Terriglobia bacterium]|nr:alpha/beta hydrolase [Terriglobia bacterium]